MVPSRLDDRWKRWFEDEDRSANGYEITSDECDVIDFLHYYIYCTHRYTEIIRFSRICERVKWKDKPRWLSAKIKERDWKNADGQENGHEWMLQRK